jgi:predicted acetyltransferase
VSVTTLIPATPDQEPVLANLLELYAHDFSEFLEIDLNEDGRFGYPHLPLYWSHPDRHPFLIRMDGKLAGFVLIRKGSEISGDPSVWDMAEFFVIRRCRRHGIGTEAAHQVWRRFPGPWEVRVMESNVPAQRFWAEAIFTFTDAPINPVTVQKGGKNWKIFSFESVQ